MHAVIPFPELVIAEGSVDHFQPQNRLAFAFRIFLQTRKLCLARMSSEENVASLFRPSGDAARRVDHRKAHDLGLRSEFCVSAFSEEDLTRHSRKKHKHCSAEGIKSGEGRSRVRKRTLLHRRNARRAGRIWKTRCTLCRPS
jgi:hypothetical protein